MTHVQMKAVLVARVGVEAADNRIIISKDAIALVV